MGPPVRRHELIRASNPRPDFPPGSRRDRRLISGTTRCVLPHFSLPCTRSAESSADQPSGKEDQTETLHALTGLDCRSEHFPQRFRHQRWKNRCARAPGSHRAKSRQAPRAPKETLSFYVLSASDCWALRTSSAQMLWCSRAHCSSTSPLPIASNAPSIPIEPR